MADGAPAAPAHGSAGPRRGTNAWPTRPLPPPPPPSICLVPGVTEQFSKGIQRSSMRSIRVRFRKAIHRPSRPSLAAKLCPSVTGKAWRHRATAPGGACLVCPAVLRPSLRHPSCSAVSLVGSMQHFRPKQLLSTDTGRDQRAPRPVPNPWSRPWPCPALACTPEEGSSKRAALCASLAGGREGQPQGGPPAGSG